MIKGNHDAESQIAKQLPDVEGVRVFSSQKSETVDLPELGVAIHGRSFPNRAVPEDAKLIFCSIGRVPSSVPPSRA